MWVTVTERRRPDIRNPQEVLCWLCAAWLTSTEKETGRANLSSILKLACLFVKQACSEALITQWTTEKEVHAKLINIPACNSKPKYWQVPNLVLWSYPIARECFYRYWFVQKDRILEWYRANCARPVEVPNRRSFRRESCLIVRSYDQFVKRESSDATESEAKFCECFGQKIFYRNLEAFKKSC